MLLIKYLSLVISVIQKAKLLYPIFGFQILRHRINLKSEMRFDSCFKLLRLQGSLHHLELKKCLISKTSSTQQHASLSRIHSNVQLHYCRLWHYQVKISKYLDFYVISKNNSYMRSCTSIDLFCYWSFFLKPKYTLFINFNSITYSLAFFSVSILNIILF